MAVQFTTESLAQACSQVNTEALLQALSPLAPLSQTERQRRGWWLLLQSHHSTDPNPLLASQLFVPLHVAVQSNRFGGMVCHFPSSNPRKEKQP